MNKLLAILFFFGAVAGVGLSQRESVQTRSRTYTGAPGGDVRTVRLTRTDRVGYLAFGIVCTVACLYFMGQIRRDNLK